MSPLLSWVFAAILHYNDAPSVTLAEAIALQVEAQGPLRTGDVDGTFSSLVSVVTVRHETNFRAGTRGDHGSSFCFFQLNLGRGKTREGWTGEDLEADVTKCATAGYRALRESFVACPSAPLAVYVSGHCESVAGRAISKRRMGEVATLAKELSK